MELPLPSEPGVHVRLKLAGLLDVEEADPALPAEVGQARSACDRCLGFAVLVGLAHQLRDLRIANSLLHGQDGLASQHGPRRVARKSLDSGDGTRLGAQRPYQCGAIT